MMHKALVFVFLILVLLISWNQLTAQHKQNDIAFVEPSILPSSPTSVKLVIKTEDEEFLEATFAPDTIPLAGIPVLENALGNVVQDSIINILDLLRLRDIVIRRPPTHTQYELSKSDLNANGKIDTTDIAYLRDILLRKKSVPYLINTNGG